MNAKTDEIQLDMLSKWTKTVVGKIVKNAFMTMEILS